MISQELVHDLADKIIKVLEGRSQYDVQRVLEVVDHKLKDAYVVTLPKQERRGW